MINNIYLQIHYDFIQKLKNFKYKNIRKVYFIMLLLKCK